MRTITPQQFESLLEQARIKPRLQRELRFGASVSAVSKSDWPSLELAAITTRSGNEGVLLIELDEQMNILPYELSFGIADRLTGRSKPIICDFCTTWQAGTNAAAITFASTKSTSTITYLCCADLKCSLHVRNKTSEALLSRSQLHEDLSTDQRTDRLREKIKQLLIKLNIMAPDNRKPQPNPWLVDT